MKQIRADWDQGGLFFKRIVVAPVGRADCDHDRKMAGLIPVDSAGGKNREPKQNQKGNKQMSGWRFFLNKFRASWQIGLN